MPNSWWGLSPGILPDTKFMAVMPASSHWACPSEKDLFVPASSRITGIIHTILLSLNNHAIPIYRPSIVFSCEWTLGRHADSSEQCWNEHGVQLALQDPEFSVSRCAPGRGTAASWGSTILNSWRNLHIVFCSSCIINILSRVHVPFLQPPALVPLCFDNSLPKRREDMRMFW